MTGREIDIACPDRTFMGYLAMPGKRVGPGVVLVQEIFGVNASMRQIADDLCESEDLFVLVPDLFWRHEPGIQLDDHDEKDLEKAFSLYNSFDTALGVEDIQATITALRGIGGCTGRVGVMGYCLGGLLAFLAAARTDTDASVSYYGVSIENHLHEAIKIATPTLLHLAGQDEFVPETARRKILADLGHYDMTTCHVYPDSGHAFARPNGENYDPDAAALANERSWRFLASNLAF